MQKQLIKVIMHCLFWSIFIIIAPILPMRPGQNFQFEITPGICITYLYLIAFFYVNAYLLIPLLIPQKKIFTYAGYIILFAFFYFIMHRTIWLPMHKSIIESIPHLDIISHPHPPIRKPGPFPFAGWPFFQFLIFYLLSVSYSVIKQLISMNQRNKEIEAEKLRVELAFLKAQIKPHFFFNTLNTIYALSLNKSEQAPEAILLFSKIVRYVQNKSEIVSVPLNEEVEYINNYIELQQMRYTDKLEIDFNVSGNREEYNISPLILIPFIENAFEYGVSNHYPSVIEIKIQVEDSSMYFTTQNKIFKSDKSRYTGKGLGIENTKKKLQLIYPDNYKLDIYTKNDYYNVNLCIKTNLK